MSGAAGGEGHRQREPWKFSIAALISVAVNAVLLWCAVRVIGCARRSRAWPTAQATVLDSHVLAGKTSEPRLE